MPRAALLAAVVFAAAAVWALGLRRRADFARPSISTSSASVSSTATSTVGLSLGDFSLLANRSTGATENNVLVSVEGKTYLSVPIIGLGSAEDDEGGGGERRILEPSGKFNFGDTSPLTRFVIGLDEALQVYRGTDATPGMAGPGSLTRSLNDVMFQSPPSCIAPSSGSAAQRPVGHLDRGAA